MIPHKRVLGKYDKRWVKPAGHDHLVIASQELHSESLQDYPVNALAQVGQP